MTPSHARLGRFASCALLAWLSFGCNAPAQELDAGRPARPGRGDRDAEAQRPRPGRPGQQAERDAGPVLSREQMLDPQACKDCHPRHYREWQSSMHAYAGDDPVFLAMNRRGQEETNGKLGDFCVRCHAPMAVLEGLTDDGLNLGRIDQKFKGVTCYFCHTTVGVNANHNNGLVLDGDGKGGTTLYGGIEDPRQPAFHRAAYSELMDGSKAESARTCGACHDIRTEKGVHLERTFAEYKTSLFSEGEGPLTCVGCHMSGRANTPAADDPTVGVPTRTVHEHIWAGVDVALTPWPDTVAQRKAVQCELSNGARIDQVQMFEDGRFVVQAETNAGHNQPSGATQDRRLWLEVIGYDSDGRVVFESGRIADDEIVDKPVDHRDYDPQLRVFRSHIYDERGEEVHMFWEAARSKEYPTGTSRDTLPPGTLGDPEHHVEVTYQLPLPLPARVAVRGRIRPMGLDVLDELIESKHLNPDIRDRMPTFTLNGMIAEWRRRDGFEPVITNPPAAEGCDYRCEFDPKDPDCR